MSITAVGYVVFPSIGKGGLGIGGASGKGTLFKASAAVAPASGVSADAAYQHSILVVSMSIGGLMYEAYIGGQKFKVSPF